MTDSTKSSPLWSEQQQQAMAALKLTLWQRNTRAEPRSMQAESSASQETFCYKSGEWLLVSAEPLAVDMPRWLKDLNQACCGEAERPAELSPSALREWSQSRIIRVPTSEPSAKTKKLLWQQFADNAQ